MKLSSLPPLNSFPDVRQPSAEAFGAALRDLSVRRVVILTEEVHREAAEIYARINGVDEKMSIIVTPDHPYDAAAAIESPGIVPLVMDSAINPDLRDRFFGNPGFGHHFADHQYVPKPGHASSELKTIGTTAHGMRQVLATGSVNADPKALLIDRDQAIRRVLGEKMMTTQELRSILQSPLTTAVPVHALGPKGTNIDQASHLYLADRKLGDKARVIVHGGGIEPMQYAKLAREQKAHGVVPMHMECVVYYGMKNLFESRPDEMVIADHRDMDLDAMQLAGISGVRLPSGRVLKIASHPSPQALLRPWVNSGAAEVVKASSNSEAALMVTRGEADLCITTESGRDEAELEKLHVFGSPNMTFTLGTPYTAEELRSMLQ